MKPWRATAVAMLVMCVSTAARADDEIGLYFGNEEYVNCAPDSVSFPFEVAMRLVLRHPSFTEGLNGWEGALSLPPTIVLLSSDLGAGSLNVAASPEFIVGYASPIPSIDDVTLATFHLLALGPGEIYLHAPERRSIEGFLGCAVVIADEDGTLIETRYAYGGPTLAVATLGEVECPITPPIEEIIEFDNPEIVPSGNVHDHFVDLKINLDPSKDSPGISWDQMWQNSDLCVRGTVTAIEIGCISDGAFPRGVVGLSIAPQEVYWGPVLSAYTIWVEGVDVPDCVSYGPGMKFALAEGLQLGAELVIAAANHDNVLWSAPWRVFSVAGSVEESLSKGEVEALQTTATVASLKGMLARADAVVLVTPRQARDGAEYSRQFDVDEILKGRGIVDSKVIEVSFPYGYMQFIGKDNERKQVLMFLTRRDDGVFELPYGARSVIIRSDGGFCSISGTPSTILR